MPASFNLTSWFQAQGFTVVRFSSGKARITTDTNDGTLLYKLRERPGYTTWYKEATGGSLIVFEVTEDEFGVKYNGYCPLLLFGIWPRKLPFKPNASGLFAYRAEGWRIAQALQAKLKER